MCELNDNDLKTERSDRRIFLDTSVLLNRPDLLRQLDNFTISSVTLTELENIKSSHSKSEEVKKQAREAVRFLTENTEKYSVVVYTEGMRSMLTYGLEDTPDNRIILCARCDQDMFDRKILFCTCDKLCELIAGTYFMLDTCLVSDNEKFTYKGYKELIVSDDELANFYQEVYIKPEDNTYDLLTNEYLILKYDDDNVIDAYRYTGSSYEGIFRKQIKSLSFGDKLKPKDIYQQIAIDSMCKNQITALSGKAGSGKSLLSLMVAMYLIDSGKYDRLVVLYNPVKARGTLSEGYYPGNAVSKAMQGSIGQILTTKFGDRTGVDILINQDKLKLVCMSDCRGMEIRDNEILWITECENTSVDLMKICLSRVSAGAKVFIEGDFEQVDNVSCMGANNGLKRVIEVFKGQSEFGYVNLPNIWRSRIAELCDKL